MGLPHDLVGIVERECRDALLLLLLPRPPDELAEVVVLHDGDAGAEHHRVLDDLARAHVGVLRHHFPALLLNGDFEDNIASCTCFIAQWGC